MRFLIDRCAGTFIAEWLRTQGHDVVESRERGPDPGDRVLLEWAAQESRILITIDTDFGQLVFLERQSHCGLIRLPDVSSSERVVMGSERLGSGLQFCNSRPDWFRGSSRRLQLQNCRPDPDLHDPDLHTE